MRLNLAFNSVDCGLGFRWGQCSDGNLSSVFLVDSYLDRSI
jgi:hypothetical protein